MLAVPAEGGMTMEVRTHVDRGTRLPVRKRHLPHLVGSNTRRQDRATSQIAHPARPLSLSLVQSLASDDATASYEEVV
jgi:hypothetical protein